MPKGRGARPSHAESLEARALFTVLPTHVPTPPFNNREPIHVQLARKLVREVTMENNVYGTPTAVTWKGIDGATVSTNKSVCSTLVTKLLKQAYSFTNANFTTWTGETSPEAEDYWAAGM